MKQSTTGNYHFLDFKDCLGIEVVYGKQVTHDFARHTHRTLCIGLVEQGIRCFLCRSDMHKVYPGQVFIIPPNEAHSCGPVDEPHTYRLLLVAADVLRLILPDWNEDIGSQHSFSTLVFDDKNLYEQLLNLHQILASNETNFYKQSVLLSIIGSVVEQGVILQQDTKISPRQYESVKRAQLFIEEHYGESFSLEDIAGYVFLSPYYLLRVFSLAIGIPPHIYQQQVRIRHAKKLLNQGFSLSEVANQTGFSDQSHFTNVFKKMVGITPGEYKKQFMRMPFH